MSSESNKPLDAALDLFVFAPVGLALTAAEEIPKLAARGRATVTGQMAMAKLLGQFAVAQGRKEIEKRLGGRGPGSEPPAAAPPPASPTTTAYQEPDEVSYDALLGSDQAPADGSAVESPPPAPPVSAAFRAEAGAPANGLAIPGYDSLSASQVVQRLAGLSADELDAVGAYEESHRGRRTILTRVRQLQGG